MAWEQRATTMTLNADTAHKRLCCSFQRIEKRRRDRINLCLAELRRLVPAAFEKQGSQKLEKAEILQLTVEHLKFLHSTGTYAKWLPGCFARAYTVRRGRLIKAVYRRQFAPL